MKWTLTKQPSTQHIIEEESKGEENDANEKEESDQENQESEYDVVDGIEEEQEEEMENLHITKNIGEERVVEQQAIGDVEEEEAEEEASVKSLTGPINKIAN
mgnify:CR=1 FL=1